MPRRPLERERCVIRVAVVGAGQWGPNLIRLFHNGQTSEVAWVIDTDRVRLSQVEARYPDVRTGTELVSPLDDSSVDAVVIATPTSTHYQLVKRALMRDKHVMVEKPITTASSEGRDLCEVADARGLVLMVGHVFVYNAAIQRVKRYLEDDALGRVYYLSMLRTNLGPIRMDVNAAWDLASHDISIANHLLGTEPITVSATGGTWINSGIEDAVFATLRYPGGVLVNLHAAWLSPRKARDITIVGERRMMTVDDMNLTEPLRIFDKGVTAERLVPHFIDSFASFRTSVREGDITIPRVAMGEPLKTECDHFVECVRYGKQPITSGVEGVAVVRVLEALNRSMAEGGQQAALRP